jgi:hypothetical protein
MYRASKKEFSNNYLFEEQGTSEGSEGLILKMTKGVTQTH